MSSQEIDEKICSLSEKGEDIYKLVVKNVSNAKPDLIISQEICEVCSAYTNQVKNAIEILDEKPEIYSMSPHDVQGILKCVKDIAEKIDEVQRGAEIVNSLNSRINKIKDMQIKKTGRLFGFCCVAPLIIVNKNNLINKFKKIGEDIVYVQFQVLIHLQCLIVF